MVVNESLVKCSELQNIRNTERERSRPHITVDWVTPQNDNITTITTAMVTPMSDMQQSSSTFDDSRNKFSG